MRNEKVEASVYSLLLEDPIPVTALHRTSEIPWGMHDTLS